MKVPLLDVTPPPEFGPVHADSRFADPTGADFDHTYVPGFSDLRRERDLAIGEMLQGKRAAKDIKSLPVNLRWVRAQRASGEPDNTKLWTAAQRGYVPVKPEDIGTKPWLKELPLGAVKDANGMIRNGDTVLCVAVASDVARNEARKAYRTQSRTAAAQDSFAAAVAKERLSVKGADPYIEATPAPKKEK
jgi:hypothetical protein